LFAGAHTIVGGLADASIAGTPAVSNPNMADQITRAITSLVDTTDADVTSAPLEPGKVTVYPPCQ
jgi:hypothetical protein